MTNEKKARTDKEDVEGEMGVDKGCASGRKGEDGGGGEGGTPKKTEGDEEEEKEKGKLDKGKTEEEDEDNAECYRPYRSR